MPLHRTQPPSNEHALRPEPRSICTAHQIISCVVSCFALTIFSTPGFSERRPVRRSGLPYGEPRFELRARHTRLRLPDAIVLATAQEMGGSPLSYDRKLAQLAGKLV
jgi:hypothetical protein